MGGQLGNATRQVAAWESIEVFFPQGTYSLELGNQPGLRKS